MPKLKSDSFTCDQYCSLIGRCSRPAILRFRAQDGNRCRYLCGQHTHLLSRRRESLVVESLQPEAI